MTSRSDLPNLLSSASLLFTLVTFLYGLSYRSLSEAAAIQRGGRQTDDLGPERRRVRSARRGAVLAATVAVTVALIFTPSAVELSRHFFERLDEGWDAFENYDAVATTLVAVTLACFVVAIHAGRMVIRLTGTLKRLS